MKHPLRSIGWGGAKHGALAISEEEFRENAPEQRLAPLQQFQQLKDHTIFTTLLFYIIFFRKPACT